MAAKRVRLAGALDRLGVLHALLEARARCVLPWRSLTVLTFHRVAAADAPGFDPEVADTTPEAFDRQVQILKRYFTLVDTRDLLAHRGGKPLPDNPAMITFDDGYRDNYEAALPILRRHGAKAVFFIASAYVDERRLFWWERIAQAIAVSPRRQIELRYPEPMILGLDSAEARRQATAALLALVKRRAGLDLDAFLEGLGAASAVPLSRDEERTLADALVMSWDQVRALAAAGMDVQSHTHRHRILQTLTPEQARGDLTASRRCLESQLQAPVHAVAYPSGHSIADNAGLRWAVSGAGFRVGLSSGTGTARLGETLDWLDVPRVAMDRAMPEPFFRGCLAIPALAW